MPADQLHEPWRSFLHDIDGELAGPTEIHCLGGFVVAEYYGLARPTSDVDIIRVRGASDVEGALAAVVVRRAAVDPGAGARRERRGARGRARPGTDREAPEEGQLAD